MYKKSKFREIIGIVYEYLEFYVIIMMNGGVYMSRLDDLFGSEKLDINLANKDSKYAFISYLESFGTTEVNSNGQLMQFNRAKYAGQTDLILVSELESLSNYFPGKVTGKPIKYGNLENMISYCFDKLKDEYSQLSEKDEYCDAKIQFLNDFLVNGKLTADHQNKESLEDLANKVFVVQEAIRNLQSRSLKNSNSIRK